MKLDICFVTYNSEKWILKCLNSIANSHYDLKNISLYFYDNASSDNTVKILEQYSNKDIFENYQVMHGKKNIGFGRGNNKASKLGKNEYIFFLNIDTEIYPNTFELLEEEIKNSEKEFDVFELRQEPYEHPKYYNPYTGETSWASGACVIFKRTLFEKIKGFDKHLFMYCEDVDISWNARVHGAKIKYLFPIKIKHFSYPEEGNFVKETQFIYTYVNNLYLRAKYGSLRNYIKGILLYAIVLKNAFKETNFKNNDRENIKKVKKEFLKKASRMLIISFLTFIQNRFISKKGFSPKFVNNFDYEFSKLDPFYKSTDLQLKEYPLVSILVRTHERVGALRETIKSIENQDYPNIEIIVVEDGKENAKSMLEKEFSHLNLIYYATKKNVGRSVAGNIAVSLSHGKYLNFLDDDDLFFPEHVSVLVKELENSSYDIAYTTAFETKINILSKEPYIYNIDQIGITYHEPFSRLNLYRNNITPIQSVMFNRKIIEECGGFDETIEACEDWDLWVRFSLNHNFLYIEKTTSLFRTPANKDVAKTRQIFLNNTFKYLATKFSTYYFQLTVEDVQNFYK